VDVFLCGLKLMVDDVRNILKEMGFDRKQICSRNTTDETRTDVGSGVVVRVRVVAGLMVMLMPAPLKESDYMVIGSVATLSPWACCSWCWYRRR